METTLNILSVKTVFNILSVNLVTRLPVTLGSNNYQTPWLALRFAIYFYK